MMRNLNKTGRFITEVLSIFLCLAILTGCKDDDPEENKIQIVDGMTKDMAKGSISMEEFRTKVEGKVWYFPRGNDDLSYSVVFGNGEISYSDLDVSTSYNDPAHYFKDGKYVCFYYHDPFLPGYNGTMYHRTEIEYTYDPNTGLVYAERGKYFSPDLKRFVFYIESASDTELVIHELYGWWLYGFDLASGNMGVKDPYSYRRCVLKAASEEEAQRDWWDKFTPDN